MLLDTSIIATAIPKITSDFHALNDVGWYGSSYLLASCSLTPMTGKIYSRYSSKWSFMIFLGVFELGSLLCALAKNSNMLIVARAVAGLGSSGMINGALTIIAACVRLEKRADLGRENLTIVVGQLGILLGPLLGGALTQHASWRWCFWINLPCGVIVAGILFLIHIPDRTVKRTSHSSILSVFKELDVIGFALFAPAAIMFLLALQWGGTFYPWNSATVIGLFCGAAGNIAVFMYWEYRVGDAALLPWSMVKQRIVWCSGVVMLFFFGSQLIISYYLAIYFQAVRGVEPTLAGVYLLPGILSQMLFAIVSGTLVGKLGYYLPWAVGSACLATIGCGLMSTFNPTTATATWIGYQIIGGIGRGSGLQMPIVAIQNCIPEKQIPVGMSLVAFAQTLGGALFLTFAQTAFSTALRTELPMLAPGVSALVVETAGATGFRAIVPSGSVDGVIESYSVAITHVLYVATGSAAACFCFAWGIGWKDIRKKKVVQPAA
ncbi:major facilitator superfamily [Amylocarpus encephaloides]|uniref:Major facilitator superfamily n=1 Tax=Amylocarpus encephaloides TaxID=45428 RepID=A0A9P8C4M2_9HELO|nr:major facilitator superfamily [Amylocarpus encephaloides]